MEREKVVEWVKKLMDKAADPATTEGERDAVQRKVEEFMARYKVTTMEATTPDEIKDHEMIQEDIKFAVPGKSNWGFMLAAGIAHVFECDCIRTRGTQKIMHFLGFPDDVETCLYFFRVFQMQVIFAIDGIGYDTVNKKNSYAKGMTTRIYERMVDTYERVKEIVPAETKALMVVKKGAVEKFRKQQFPKTSKSTLKDSIDHQAFIRGYKDGEGVSIADNSKKQVER